MDSHFIIALLDSWGMPLCPTYGHMHIRCEPERWASYSYDGDVWILFSYQRHDDHLYVEV